MEIKDLCFAYEGEMVLRDVNLSLRRGELLALIGPNGGGKSTLIKLLLGLLRPTCGEIRVLGRLPGESLEVGYVPQDTSVRRFFPIRAVDVVALGCKLPGRRLRGEDYARALEAMERFGVGECRDMKMSRLSGGQRQKVLIARAFASSPRVLFMDEPTANLDPASQKHLYGELKRFCDEGGTVVVASHDLMAVSAMATSVACIRGTLHYHPSPEVDKASVSLAYGECPVELVAHGIPHRVLSVHDDLKEEDHGSVSS
ncbi:metal ABC transporter ATP-binding protein [Thermanaerovibrio velox]|uniref:metal ABC transporter ATP-binding protein n=1 Tax=Thermanaerovibrio velox TaxID=108007 RepID=UPI001FE23715|nr:ATP-binding cassette domain-containing protein [Thermanaerovibrio velox]